MDKPEIKRTTLIGHEVHLWYVFPDRVTEPELNPFLVAPLAKSAGGSGRCGKPVFPDKDDPDYQAILAAFAQAQAMLAATPRIDMPGGQPSSSVSRSCQ